jgi:hypothetical protein
MITIELSYAKPKLYPCQECGTMGDVRESGRYYTCGWCNGTGEVDGPTKARWLNEQKRTKNKLSARRPVQWVWFE